MSYEKTMISDFMKNTCILFLSLFLLQSCAEAQQSKSNEDSITLSESFLRTIAAKEDTQEILERYANLDAVSLEKELDTEEKKLVFWINTYNAFIQDFLIKDPSLYEDRGAFFGKDRMAIAGESLSFDDLDMVSYAPHAGSFHWAMCGIPLSPSSFEKCALKNLMGMYTSR